MEYCHTAPSHIDRAQKSLIINGVTKKKKKTSVCKIVSVAKYEACTSEACLRKLKFKILLAVGQAHHQHRDRCLTDAISVPHLQRIPGAAA